MSQPRCPDSRIAQAANRRQWLVSCATGGLATLAAAGVRAAPAARPADYRVGINAGVSFNESEDQQRRRYAGLLDSLARGLGQRLDFGVVYSDRVAQALQAGAHDFLLIHTHAALRAEREKGWRLLAFSNDRKDNAVHFFVRPDSAVRGLEQLAAVEIGAPGLQSWATATARAALRAQAPHVAPRFIPTRVQEVVPYMVSLRTVPAGLCRSKGVVDESVAAGRIRVVHTTPQMPLYALIAAPGVPAEVCDRLRLLALAADAPAFEGLPLRGLNYASADAGSLREFFSA